MFLSSHAVSDYVFVSPEMSVLKSQPWRWWYFEVGPYRHSSFLLCSALGQTLCFYKLKVWGNPVSSKSISASFPIAFSHFVSVCRILVNLTVFQRVFPRWRSGKESPWQCRRCRSDPWVGSKIPWRRKWQPIPVFFPGKVHGQRNLVGYGLWGRKEPDMTEHSCPHSVSNFFMIIMLDMIICSQWSLMLLLWLTEASDIG